MSGLSEAFAAALPSAQTSAEAAVDHFPGQVHHVARGPAWQDLLVEIRTPPPCQKAILIPAVPEPQIVWILEGSQLFEEREIGGSWQQSQVSSGDMFLTASPSPYEARWCVQGEVPMKVMTVYVGLPLLVEAARDLYGAEAEVPALREFSAEPDEAMRGLLEQLRRELLEQATASTLLVQGLARSLAVHLLRTYGQVSEARSRRRSGLSAFQLAQVDQLLESRMDRNVSLVELADEVGMSPFHFSRVFKKSTGVTPSKYMVRARNVRARRLLRESELSVMQVSLEVGYSSASHFTDVFRRETGVTPSEYRNSL